LYCDKVNDKKRRTIQTVLYQVFYSYLLALLPIIPHTCEEAYKSFNVVDKKESICLCTIDDLKFNQIPLTPIYPEK
jgi:isoleucyl-tRNA synthetase